MLSWRRSALRISRMAFIISHKFNIAKWKWRKKKSENLFLWIANRLASRDERPHQITYERPWETMNSSTYAQLRLSIHKKSYFSTYDVSQAHRLLFAVSFFLFESISNLSASNVMVWKLSAELECTQICFCSLSILALLLFFFSSPYRNERKWVMSN